MLKPVDPERLKLFRVIDNGRIDPWGTILLLGAGLRAPRPLDRTAPIYSRPGPMLWSEKLLGYSHRKFRASLQGHGVVVKRNGTVVASIPFSELFLPEVSDCVVLKSGYLEYALRYSDVEYWTPTARALRRAVAGKMPAMFSESTYVHVSKGHEGQEVVRIDFRGDDDEVELVRVFSKEGVPIACMFHRPLARARWERKYSSARLVLAKAATR